MRVDQPNRVRIVTAASLFDGHDAAINIMRRIMQSKGAEIIHLGHNRSVHEIVECAIEEDAHGVAVTSYQGGHVEFFKYMKDLLDQAGCGHIRIFGGGGGTILPAEIRELHDYGITRIYSPDDGRSMGLEGMISDVIDKCRVPSGTEVSAKAHPFWTAPSGWHGKAPLGELRDIRKIARNITRAEQGLDTDQYARYDTSDRVDGGLGKDKYRTTDHTNQNGATQLRAPGQVPGVDGAADAHRSTAIPGDTTLSGSKPANAADNSTQARNEATKAVEGSTGAGNELTHAVYQSTNTGTGWSPAVGRSTDTGNGSSPDGNDASQAVDDRTNEDGNTATNNLTHTIERSSEKVPVLGITGTGGSGKSSVTDEIVRRFLRSSPTVTLAVICVDPSKKKSGGALLGDRIRMNAIAHPRAYMRSLATRDDNTALSAHVRDAIQVCRTAGFDLIILESAGVGQSDTAILDFCDVSMYVMTPEYGAASQLEKINMLDYADLIVVNKSDKAGAADALHDVKKQYKRNHGLWDAKDEALPVVGTVAAQFNDAGINDLFQRLLTTLTAKTTFSFTIVDADLTEVPEHPASIIPPKRIRYLSEIAENNRSYDKWAHEQAATASALYQLEGAKQLLDGDTALISKKISSLHLDPYCKTLLDEWVAVQEKYNADFLEYTVRGRAIKQELTVTSLSGTRVPKVMLPKYKDWGDILKWRLQENVPGEFPFTAGVFELKREGEDPTRMFAGEGGPERTNKRFHYVSSEQPAIRLSTAFDSVTLYGEDPDERPDIFGKIGNAGVSIATVDDAKKLYSGFDLCATKTSVSMTINGPAPMMLAFFMNAAIDQQCEIYIHENNLWPLVEQKATEKYTNVTRPVYHDPAAPGHPVVLHDNERYVLGLGLLGLSGDEVLDPEVYRTIKNKALMQVRGTVQADILKEDQAQNTCIFSTEFALKLMGDVQQYFIDENIRNFYSVSISGYHIAEAGANPITQLAFTLSNGFTYLEYYLSRGMKIDDFAPNLSFFFSNGMDPEYSVIGRVARRIWAKAIRNMYKGNERSQKLKYHIQTSGRSLHAQEIDFNDIRTTLQALYAIYDNCNSLHTNAYDEAITTPTEESVRRAMAIQLIINRELGTAKNENPLQGSFLFEELTDLVEEAVLAEFDRITERGGVLGAMERMYQRNKIQEESLHYESLKHNGELPIIGVNTFLSKNGSPTLLPGEVIRSTTEEKLQQISNLRAFCKRNESKSGAALKKLQHAAVKNDNLFAELMETVKYCSLGQITHALYEVGGQYRRNM